jgi:hypothetical protein
MGDTRPFFDKSKHIKASMCFGAEKLVDAFVNPSNGKVEQINACMLIAGFSGCHANAASEKMKNITERDEEFKKVKSK